MAWDISLVEDHKGRTTMHRPDCPIVQGYRVLGRPIATLYQCESLPTDVRRHVCLAKERHDPVCSDAPLPVRPK